MLRVETLGHAYERAADAGEVAAMGARLGAALAQGSLGLSTGLGYPNSAAADTEEIIGLARHMAPYDGALYVTHMRDESDRVLEALAEAFEIGARAELPVVISHHKWSGRRNYGRSRETLAAIEAAAARQSVGLDVYPYTASSTVLAADYAREAEAVLIASSEPHPEMAGRALAEVAPSGLRFG